jgi:hypothetical protein
MRKVTLLFLLSLTCAAATTGVAAQDCSDYSFDTHHEWGALGPPGTPGSVQGTIDHQNGGHSIFMPLGGTCQYSGDGASKYCSIEGESYVDGGTDTWDTGGIITPLHYHEVTLANNPGGASSNGAQIATEVLGAAAADSCWQYIHLCNVNITFSGSASGVGATATFPSTNLKFTPSFPWVTTCTEEDDPQWQNCYGPDEGVSGPETVAHF